MVCYVAGIQKINYNIDIFSVLDEQENIRFSVILRITKRSMQSIGWIKKRFSS